jgi:hypothetical protein
MEKAMCPEALGSLTRPGPITNINTDLVFRIRLETESMRIPCSIITTAIMIIIIRNVTAAHLRCSFCDQPRIFLKYCGCVYVCRKQRKNNSQGRSTHDASSRQVILHHGSYTQTGPGATASSVPGKKRTVSTDTSHSNPQHAQTPAQLNTLTRA